MLKKRKNEQVHRSSKRRVREVNNCNSKFKVRQILEIQKCVDQEMGGNSNEI